MDNLLQNYTMVDTPVNGLLGGIGNNKIFLPIMGFRNRDGALVQSGSSKDGHLASVYWTDTHLEGYESMRYYAILSKTTGIASINFNGLKQGHSIRCVSDN